MKGIRMNFRFRPESMVVCTAALYFLFGPAGAVAGNLSDNYVSVASCAVTGGGSFNLYLNTTQPILRLEFYGRDNKHATFLLEKPTQLSGSASTGSEAIIKSHSSAHDIAIFVDNGKLENSGSFLKLDSETFECIGTPKTPNYNIKLKYRLDSSIVDLWLLPNLSVTDDISKSLSLGRRDISNLWKEWPQQSRSNNRK